MLEKLNGYAMALLTVTVAVSSVLRLTGLDQKPWAKPVLSLCFDVGGAVRGLLGIKGDAPQPPAAK